MHDDPAEPLPQPQEPARSDPVNAADPGNRRTAGRPAHLPDSVRMTAVMLERDTIEWAKAQPGGLSATLRRLLHEAKSRAERDGIIASSEGDEARGRP